MWHYLSGVFDEIRTIISTSWHIKWELLFSFSPFLIVLMAFLSFILWNGSIVLGNFLSPSIPYDCFGRSNSVFHFSINTAGAKEAHAVSPHFAQILYFSLVSVMATAPMHFTVTQAMEMFRLFWKNRSFSFFLGLLALTGGFLSVHLFRLSQT